mgnify:CR=1 FL=1
MAVAIYLAIGAALAVFLAAGGAVRLDRAAKGAGIVFRIFIIPGAALLWPLLLLMWIAGAGANKRDAA